MRFQRVCVEGGSHGGDAGVTSSVGGAALRQLCDEETYMGLAKDTRREGGLEGVWRGSERGLEGSYASPGELFRLFSLLLKYFWCNWYIPAIIEKRTQCIQLLFLVTIKKYKIRKGSHTIL